MSAQVLDSAGQPGQPATRRALALGSQLRAAGLAPLRTAIEPEGFSFLLSTDPWLEVRVDADGAAVAFARSPAYAEPVMLALPTGGSFSALHEFLASGQFPLDT